MDESIAPQLPQSIAAAAESVNGPRGVDDRVRAAVRAALVTIPGFDQASISVVFREEQRRFRAASSLAVEELDVAEHDAEQGPGFDAFTRPDVVLVPSTRDEGRWPTYIERATRAGVTAQMAVPLRRSGEVRGSLSLYRTSGEGIHPQAPDIAALFATHVAFALGFARIEEELNKALSTRKMIGQAIGILMERYRIDDAKAFGFLTRVSQTGNVKLRDVAQEIVSQTDARYSSKDT